MKPLDRTKKSSLSSQPQHSQKLIGELEPSMVGLTHQLLATQAGLEHEVAERQRLEEKFWSLLELIPQALIIVRRRST